MAPSENEFDIPEIEEIKSEKYVGVISYKALKAIIKTRFFSPLHDKLLRVLSRGVIDLSYALKESFWVKCGH